MRTRTTDIRAVGNKKEKTCFNMRINKIFGGEDGENLGEGRTEKHIIFLFVENETLVGSFIDLLLSL